MKMKIAHTGRFECGNRYLQVKASTVIVLGISLFLSIRNVSDLQIHIGPKGPRERHGTDNWAMIDEVPETTIKENLLLQRDKIHQSNQSDFAVQILRSRISRNVVCRFNNACVGREGTIILHPYLHDHHSIKSTCKVNPQFMNSGADFSETSFTSKFDLLRFYFPRCHIPHFFSDFFPSLMAFDILTDSSSERVERTCVSLSSNKSCIFSELRFAHFIPDRDFENNNFSSWIPRFHTIFSNDWYFYSRNSWFHSATNVTNRCFKSVIRFNHKSLKMNNLNWISRTVHGQSTSPGFDDGKLWAPFQNWRRKINLLFLNRYPKTGRSIVNVKEIVDALPKFINRTITSYEISDVFMEDITFIKQMEIVRQADLIIGSHGAGLTNIIFSRSGTAVFEIYPFFYYPPNFLHLSARFNLKYDYMVAEPDTETYMKCMYTELRKFPNMTNIAAQRWEQGLVAWKQAGKGMVNIPNLLGAASSGRNRICLRAQQLHVNITELSTHLSNLLKLVFQNKLNGT